MKWVNDKKIMLKVLKPTKHVQTSHNKNTCRNQQKLFYFFQILLFVHVLDRGGSRTAATSKMEHFVITVDGFWSLTIIRKCSILDVAAVLHPPLKLQKPLLKLNEF